jgi:cytochrome P450
LTLSYVVQPSQLPYRDDALDQVVVTKADDVDDVLADKTLSNDRFNARPTALAGMGLRPEDRGFMTLAQADGQDHTRLRRLLTKAFSARAIDAMRPQIKTIAASLLDAIDPREPFDLVTAFASPLPTLVITTMLGLADADIASFKTWSDDLLLMLKPQKSEAELQRMVAAIGNLDLCTTREIARRKAVPSDDLIGALVAAQEDGDQLTEAEIINNTRLLLSAGNVTTTDLISNGVVTLLEHDGALSELRAQPSLWPAAIEEILRYRAPVNFVTRLPLGNRKLNGCPIDAGQTITAMLASANHDPALHSASNRFDIHRQRQKHFSFGGGAHFCLGASLARLEGEIALAALFERFPKLRLASDRPPQPKIHPMFNGFSGLWVTV